MLLLPQHLGHLCQYCDAMASHYHSSFDEYVCPEHICLFEECHWFVETALEYWIDLWRIVYSKEH